MRPRVWLAAAALFAFPAASGCDDPTSVAVRVTADIPCSTLKGVLIRATSPGKPEGPETRTTRCVDGADEATVGTLILVPSGDPDAKLSVTVIAGLDRPAEECAAANYEGCVIARRTLRFVAKRELDLPIVVRGQCKGIACDGTATCVAGTCRTAKVDDPADCVGDVCSEGSLAGRQAPPPVVLPDGAVVAPVTPGPAPDAGLTCGTSEKVCGGACVSAGDPRYGCTLGGCEPCAGLDIGDFACATGLCTLIACKAGYKKCGEGCVPTDVAHGCSAAACQPCDAANGTASCEGGQCALTCSSGYKLCGGKCVDVTDPSYGCGLSGCTACSPDSGGGTILCSANACTLGTCPAGTKNCNQKCVPTDRNNGCAAASCTPCAADATCQGMPTVCTCVPQSDATVCAAKGFNCGSTTNNCGGAVTCGSCTTPNSCAGGGTANVCGCTPNNAAACSGKNCGTVGNNCGQAVSCGTCASPDSCGGAGAANVCGCTPTLDCNGNCGYYDNGCGTQVYCGDCGGGGCD